MKKTKIYLTLGALTILVFYGVFQTLQGKSLLGFFPGTEIIVETGTPLSDMDLDSYTSAELVSMADAAKNASNTYEASASSAASQATIAYENYDADSLESAQVTAETNADAAETKAELAQSIADELYSRYEFEARVEALDKIVNGVNIDDLIIDLQGRYESSQVEYGRIFEEYYHNFEVEIPNPTDDGGTDEWVYDWTDEMLGTVVTETDFWTDYEVAKEEYLDAYNDLYGLLDAAGGVTDYLSSMEAYENNRQELETQIFELGITNAVVENMADTYSANASSSEIGTMLTENYGIINMVDTGSYTSTSLQGNTGDLIQGVQTQMNSFETTLDSINSSTLNVERVDTVQLQNFLLNNYSRNVFFNNILSASELDKNVFLASGETADDLYAYYELAYADALEASASATASSLSLAVANSYVLKTCTSLALSPSSYSMDWDDTEAEFTLTVTPNISTSTALHSKWAGELTFLTNGGYFTYGGVTDYMIQIPLTDTTASAIQVSYTKGSVDDLIKVYVPGEESTCSESFSIIETTSPDSDGDGLSDEEEAALGTNPASTDSDGDGLSDSAEVTAGTDPLKEDTDGGSIHDGAEVTAGTNPLDPSDDVASTTTSTDTDGDGIDDATDTDDDGDGLSDYDEIYTYGTDPLLKDTDGDGLSDYEEIYVYDTDPLDKTSASTGTCNTLSLSPSTLELDEDESSTIAIEVDIDGTWDGGVYVVWSDNDGFVTTTDGEIFESEFEGEGPLTTGTYYLLYTSGGNSGTEDETETLSISLEGSSCTDTIEITIPATNALTSTEDCEEDYQDVEEDDWFGETVCRLTDAGFVEGRVQYSSYSLFYPSDEITKAEVFKLISLILLDLDESDAQGKTSGFTDPNLTTEWFYWAVLNLEDEDVIRTRDAGTIGNFNSNITRGELAVYIARALGLTSYSYELEYTDVDEDDWFAYAVALLSRTDDEYVKDMLYDGTDEALPVIEGYVETDGDVTFEPYSEINRAEALTMIYRAYQIYIAD